jgi:glutathione S-transferase
MSVSEINATLGATSYVAGPAPSAADAKLFDDLFGGNAATIQWAARMASYYASERGAFPAAAPAAHFDPAQGGATPESAASLEAVDAALAETNCVAGPVPTAADAQLFGELFGGNAATVQWAARMASYYASERDEFAAPAPAAAAPAVESSTTPIAELNGALGAANYVAGAAPTAADAQLFKDLFGGNAATLQWAARMASYYDSERAALPASS